MSGTGAAANERTSVVAVLLLVVWLATAMVFYAHWSLNHDTSYFLLATRRWFAGATLYRDIVETNPPLIFYLTAPAVAASELLGISASTAFVIFVCLRAGCTLVWCWSVLRRVPEIPAAGRYAIVAACFAALIVTPAYNFGQREHLFIVFALPYFLALGLSAGNLRLPFAERAALGFYAFF